MCVARSDRMDVVSHLMWVERDHGWRAGPYELELAAPQLWVCTRSKRNGEVVVEMTSGSLSALKRRVEKLAHRRRNTKRSLFHLTAFAVALALALVAAIAGSSVTPLLVALFSSLGLFSLLKAVDYVIGRSWESVHLYQ